FCTQRSSCDIGRSPGGVVTGSDGVQKLPSLVKHDVCSNRNGHGLSVSEFGVEAPFTLADWVIVHVPAVSVGCVLSPVRFADWFVDFPAGDVSWCTRPSIPPLTNPCV